MAQKIFLFSKLFVVVVLLAVFINYFGLKSVERYQEKKVYVTSTAKLEKFIPAPALTICPLDPVTLSSFPNVPELPEEKKRQLNRNPFHFLCGSGDGNTTAIVDCVEKLTYNLTHVVKLAAKGINPRGWKEAGPVEEHWKAEFTNGKSLCLIHRSPHHFGSHDSAHAIVVGLNPDLEYYVFIHDPNFFVLSHNPGLGLNTLYLNMKQSIFAKMTVVEHRNLDVPNKRCNPDTGYSFTGCIKEAFSKEVGCRMHWDEHNDKSIPICSNMKQFFELQVRYGMISKAVQLEVSDRTGCLIPCNYIEYKVQTTDSNNNKLLGESGITLWNTSPYVLIETESLVLSLEALVAEIGGSLGLFLGFSFLTLWDVVVEFLGALPAKLSIFPNRKAH